MTTLFRPVGLNELSLIWDSGMREFPRALLTSLSSTLLPIETMQPK